MQDAQRRGPLEVSIKMRFPVIGSRMVMEQSYPVQAHEKRRTPELARSLLHVWLRDSYCTLAAPQQIEAVHLRPVCRLGSTDPGCHEWINKSMVAGLWLTIF